MRCPSVIQLSDCDLIRPLQHMLYSHNRYIQSFKTVIQRVPSGTHDFNVVIYTNKIPIGDQKVRYNVPSTSEVVGVTAGQKFDKRDIVLRKHDNNLITLRYSILTNQYLIDQYLKI